MSTSQSIEGLIKWSQRGELRYNFEAALHSSGEGLGILVGDGRLPHPDAEKIIEMYYSVPLFAWQLTLDYQFVVNPAYNRDRGPVSVIGTRLHTQF